MNYCGAPAAGVLTIEAWSTDGTHGAEESRGSAGGRESGAARLAMMRYDGQLPYATVACVVWAMPPESTSTEREI